MKVVNVHKRLLHAPPERVGALIDTLASPADALWPGPRWPRMQFDRPLAVGACGGHGPIRYTVEAYEAGQLVRFRFTAPTGFDGWHGFEVLDATAAHCVLEHRIEMHVRGPALLTWPLAIRHLHDACVEDALSQAQAALGNTPTPVPWPARVRLLHRLATRRQPKERARAARRQPGRRPQGKPMTGSMTAALRFAPWLIAGSAGVLFVFGTLHLVFTFTGNNFDPRDPQLKAWMMQVSPVISRETTMWKAWIGFNASHSYGAMLYGLVYGYLALWRPAVLFESWFLLALGVVLLAGLVFLGRVYWFSTPYWGILVASALYLGGLALRFA